MEIQQPKSQLSDLLEPILRALHLYNTPEKLSQMKFTLELHLLMLQKLPHMYLSNRQLSIQVQLKTQKSKISEQYPLDPFNKIKTHYYLHTPKSYLVLNCPDKLLQIQPEQINDAYCPQFYFSGDKWQQFKKQRIYIKKTDDLDSIIITEWGLKIINVSLSGHYGIVLQVYKSRRGNLETQVKLPQITSLMYQQEIRKYLSKMRLQHVKKIVSNEIQNQSQQKISMCYHLRASKSYLKITKGLQFVSIDNSGEILAYDKTKRRNYVTVGDLQGMCSFPQSINLQEVHQDNQSRLNIQLQAYQKNTVINNILKVRQQLQERKLSKKLEQQERRRIQQELDEIGSPFSQSEDEEGEVQISQQDNNQVQPDEEKDSQSSQENQYFKKYRQQAKLNKII